MQFEHQVVLVTGASRGIGRDIALRLAREGANVAINYHRDSAGASETAMLIRDMGREAEIYQADVASFLETQAMVDVVIERFGQIDVLVNNAGITADNLLVNMDEGDIEKVIRTNLCGVIYPTRFVAAHMMRRRRGRIVNLSSSAASKPGRGQSNYAAAKGGVESFTRAMAVELAPRNIIVNAVAPGVIKTQMSAQIRQHANQEIMEKLLLKRCAETSEVADVVAFLASPANQYITGEVVHINGGLKMG